MGDEMEEINRQFDDLIDSINKAIELLNKTSYKI